MHMKLGRAWGSRNCRLVSVAGHREQVGTHVRGRGRNRGGELGGELERKGGNIAVPTV